MSYNVDAVVDKQITNTKNAGQRMRDGIAAVQKAPGQSAADNSARWIAAMSDPATHAKWAARVSAVSLADWKQAMLEKGVPRVSAGIDAARSKIQKFHTQLSSFRQTLDAEIDAMPNVTLEDGIARAERNIRRMAEFSFDPDA